MSRDYYEPKQIYLGDGTLDTYTFDFKIEALTQLLVVVVDTTDVETERVRGDDTVFIDSVTFDSTAGGGTVVLVDVLPLNYRIALLLANDEPSQSYQFSNKTSFSLKRFENALDFIVGPIQRLVFRANQSLRIHDLDDEEAFNTQLPAGVVDYADCILAVHVDGDRFTFGPTVTEVEGWKTDAEAAAAAALLSEIAAAASLAAAAIAETNAETAETNAETAETNAAASAVAAAASAASVTPKYQFLATQTLNNGDKITVNNTYPMQMVYVQGNGGDITVDVLPFVAPPDSGALLTIMGLDDAAKVAILYNDVAGGYVGDDCYLGKYQTVSMVYDPTLNRYLKVSRSY